MSLLKTLFGGGQSEVTEATTILELITQSASLASNPREIDPILDRVREVSATLRPGQALSPTDTQTLLGVYLEIEQYLITKEALRTFTSEQLRAHATPELRSQISAFENKKKGEIAH